MVSLARNKKNTFNKSESKKQNLITFRVSDSELQLYNKAKIKKNMSQWLRQKLLQDFGDVLTKEEIIQIKYKELYSLQEKRDNEVQRLNYEIDSLVQQINDLKNNYDMQELHVFK